MMKYNFNVYADAGHAWLAVDRLLLRALGIEDKISSYSYMDGAIAYLEEDCDAGVLANALKAKGIEYTLRGVDHGSWSPIRSYKRYSEVKL